MQLILLLYKLFSIMPGKSQSGKPLSKAKKKKSNILRTMVIIIVMIIMIVFLIFSVYTPPARKKSQDRPLSSISRSGPIFRKDGTLSVLNARNQTIVNIEIEVADEEAERMRGLMDRISMPENAGMLFIFEEEEQRSFWMKNTFISLDIIYINANKEIVSIQKYTQPKTTTAIPSDAPAKYVLEVNAGFADKFVISAGDKIDFNL